MGVYTSNTPVRVASGATQTGDISDSNLNDLIDIAERYMLDDLLIYVHDERLIGDINGTNKKFETRHEPIGDREVLGVIDGSPADVTAYSLVENSDEPDDYTELTVSSVTRQWGEIELDSAPSSDVDAVLGSYAYYSRPVREDMLKNAATYLATHLVTLLMEAPDRVTLSDIERNSLIIETTPTRFWNMYKLIIGACGDKFRAVAL